MTDNHNGRRGPDLPALPRLAAASRRLLFAALGGLVLAFPAPSPAAAPTAETAFDATTAPESAMLPLDPEIRTGRLDNGLTYFVRRNAKPENRAELRLAVNAGAVLESDDQRGLAHFLEHMAFNGTRDLPKHELVDFLQRIGLRFGADLNAFTAFDETVYQLTVPTDDPAQLDKSLLILENWANEVSLDPDEIDKEKGVVTEEWRLGRGPFQRVFDKVLPLLFAGSLYADRLPIGTKESIQAADKEKLTRFYRDWYRPDLMAVVIVGDFDPAAIEAKVKTLFGAIPKREGKARPTFAVPPTRETLVSLVEDPELPVTQIGINFKHPADPDGAVGDYRRGLVEALYHAMFNARLVEMAQSADPPFIMARSQDDSFVRPMVIYSLDAVVRDGGALRGFEALLREVERVDRHGFTATELARAKTDLLRGFEQAVKERDKAPSQPLADEYVRHFLEGEPAPGIEREAQLARRFTPTITLDEVNRLGAKWITPDNRLITASGPAKKDAALPSQEEVLALFAKVDQEELKAYVDQVRDEPLVAAAPQGQGVVAETKVPEVGVTEWKLANGTRVLLKPTDFQNDQILMGAYSPGGSSLFSDEDFPSGALAAQVLAQGGLGQFKQSELEKQLAGKVVNLDAQIGELEEGLEGEASPQDLETLLQLVYLKFTAPRLDPDAFKNFHDRMANFIANRPNVPAAVFQDEMTRALWGNHPRRRPPSLETLAQVKPDRVLAAYQDRFADASDFTFVFVGNFDPATIKPLIEKWIGGLPSIHRQETFRDLGLRFPAKAASFRFQKGVDPKSSLQFLWGGEAPWSREQAHLLDSLTDALQIELTDKIREEMGAAYGVGVGGGLQPRPVGTYQVAVRLQCAPDEVEPIVRAIREMADRYRREGPSQAVVDKVKQMQRREREVALRDNGFWLGILENYYANGLDPRLIPQHDKLVDSLTPAALKGAAERYLDPARSVVGVLDPEKAPDPPPAK